MTTNVFNVTAGIATDVEFRCLDQATAFSGVTHDLFKSVWFYEFNRSYQTPGFSPNVSVLSDDHRLLLALLTPVRHRTVSDLRGTHHCRTSARGHVRGIFQVRHALPPRRTLIAAKR